MLNSFNIQAKLPALFFGMNLLCGAVYADTWCENLSKVDETAKSRMAELAVKVETDTARAVAQLKTEGLLPGQGLHDGSQVAKQDFAKARALAYGWRASGNQNFLQGARRFIVAWSNVYKPSFNPIDETELTQLWEAYAIIRDDLPSAEATSIDQWILLFFQGYLQDIHSRVLTGNVQTSNWQSHRIKILAAAAGATGQQALFYVVRPFFKSQIDANIKQDGRTEDFLKRDALSYVTYSLQPLVEAALIAHAAGSDWLPSGSLERERLIKALDWLWPYANGEKEHIEYQNSTVKFDKVRAEKKVRGHVIAPWNPANARELYWNATYLDSKYAPLANKLSQRPSIYLKACRGTP